MSQSDGEIEYLEEDAEIVQQCVQLSLHTAVASPIGASKAPQPQVSLLVERPQVQKRKKKKEVKQEDSEYDPSEDNMPPSPPSPPARKRKVLKPLKKEKVKPNPSVVPNTVSTKNKAKEFHSSTGKEQLINRKKYNIRIPDYDDPLCLPVRAIKAEDSDKKRLDNWNNVCLEHFKHCDTILKPEIGETKRSVRTAVFRNVVNKQTGNPETTIWSKTCVENSEGDKKSEIFQCVLPRYKEKKVLGNYILGNPRHHPSIKTLGEVVLSKETHKDGEALVVYKPKEALSAVYGLIDKRKKAEDQEAPEAPAPRDTECQLFLQELTACKLCASCFQSSWRGLHKYKRKSVVCPMCARTYVTVYNLLSHFKTHAAADVLRYKKIISQILADIVGYHYKCRICRKQFDSIRNLRCHIVEHQSKEVFKCEVCSQIINKHLL